MTEEIKKLVSSELELTTYLYSDAIQLLLLADQLLADMISRDLPLKPAEKRWVNQIKHHAPFVRTAVNNLQDETFGRVNIDEFDDSTKRSMLYMRLILLLMTRDNTGVDIYNYACKVVESFSTNNKMTDEFIKQITDIKTLD